MSRIPLVVFAVAAGPRLGFGHLLRSRSLARAMDVPWRVHLRGTAAARGAAVRLGAILVEAPAPGHDDTALLVVDDPSPREAHRWVTRARLGRVPVATIHDLGLNEVDSDLIVDGSLYQAAPHPSAPALRGPAFAILDPRLALTPRARETGERVLITLGGGTHVHGAAAGLCGAIARRRPRAQMRVARGFAPDGPPVALAQGRWIDAPDGLASELAHAAVAVAAGGVTLLEACALGVPVVAIAVTDAQALTIRALAARGAVVDGGRFRAGDTAFDGVADAAAGLLANEPLRRQLARNASALVDGRGALRVAAQLRRLMAEARLPEARHAS